MEVLQLIDWQKIYPNCRVKRNNEKKLKVRFPIFEKVQYSDPKVKNYEVVANQLKYVIEGEDNSVANLSKVAALLNSFLDEMNWRGFYLMDDEKNHLLLVPFQGLPICIRIPLNKVVCGMCASTLDKKRLTFLK